MLVLTRHKHEAIQIGDDITLHIIKIRGNRVQLGIEAPANVPVNRLELLEPVVSVSPPYSSRAECARCES